jgi:uncharacterized protein (DUF58 family)
MPVSPLLSPSFLQKLERLSFVARRTFAGQMQGERRSPRKGASIEFADFREYTPGDDLRYVDWKAFGRLERLFLKLFVEEEDLSVHLLVDTSKSMDFGEPVTKIEYAKKVAAALGFIGLTEYDRITVAAFSNELSANRAPLRGKSGIQPLFRFLENLPTGGGTDFGATLRRYTEQKRTPGIAIVLSDFFAEGVADGLKALAARRYQVVLLHIVTPEEADPEILGDLRLIDSETGLAKEVTLSPYVLAQYKDRFASFCAELEDLAHRYSMDYVRMTTAVPFEDVFFRYLRTSGLLR